MTQVAEPEATRWVGGGLKRKEDPKLITGQGRYVDDITLPGMVYLAFARSPVAHANIASIDTSAAKELPGVVAVYTGPELADEWAAAMPCAWPVTSRTYPGEPTADARVPDHWPVAKDRVRYMGEIVAVVVADSREHAVDATEAVDVDYDELPVVDSIEEAVAEGGHVIHEQFDSNELYTWELHNGEVDKVFAEAPVVVKERYFHPRLIANAIEPRGVVVQPVPAQGEFTVWTSTEIPHILRVLLTLVLGIPETKLRVIALEVGGGFGSKLEVYAEEFTAVVLARKLGLPIKWTESRSEGYLATVQGRGVIQDMEVAATEEGRLLGVRVKLQADMGAYASLCGPGIPILGAFLYHGVYEAQAYAFEATGVFTNRTPTDAYRGSGRPEATYAIERIMDALARRVGKDPAEVRAMNFIPPFDQPRVTAGTLEYDSGNYQAALAKAKELVGYDELRREQQANDGRRDGKLLGIGISSYIEMSGWAPSQVLGTLQYAGGGWERASVRCNPTGKVTVVAGTSAQGQGHATTFSQIVADDLGVTPDDVEVLAGDTSIATWGLDSYGSRSMSVGGVAIHRAAERVREKARILAAHELEVAEDDLEWADGRFQVKGAPDRAKTVPELAFSAWTAHDLPEGVDPLLEASAVFDPPNWTFPSGTHICVVEVDPETGSTRIKQYVAVDDCGTIINPLVVDGQVMGGVAQGIAEALYEEALYDENGTLLTGNMSTYRIPSAAELPGYTLGKTVTPSSTNPMGVKGIGETGTIAAPPAVMNAVADALRFVGVEFIDKPATPERVWRSLQSDRAQLPPSTWFEELEAPYLKQGGLARVPGEVADRHQQRRVDVGLKRLEDSAPAALESSEDVRQALWVDPYILLRVATRYRLIVQIGRHFSASLMEGEPTPIDPLLSGRGGRTLEVAVYSSDFALRRGGSRKLTLPDSGASRPVQFEIRTPVEPRTAARLRVAIYNQNHLVQSFVLQAAVAEEERRTDQRALTVALEFSRTSSFDNLDTLQPRIASIGINQVPGTVTHQLMVKGDGLAPKPFSMDPGAVEQPLEGYRAALRNATYDEREDPRFPADGEVTPERRALFEQTIRDLAEIGGDLYDGLWTRAKPLEYVLGSIASSSDETIQVVRFDMNNVLPWAAMYDYGRPTPIAGAPVKPVCLGWGLGIKPQWPPAKVCDHGPHTKAYCIYGFWGIRHVIEELIPLGDETVESDAKLEVTRLDSKNAVWLSIDRDDDFTGRLENQLRDLLGADVVRRIQPGDDLLALLWQADQRPVVLIVLGHVETEAIIINDEPIQDRIVLVPDAKWLIVRDLIDKAKLQGRWAAPQTVVLLMGCGTAVVTPKTLNSFVTALSTIGAGAVLGTECLAFSSLVARFAGSITTQLWKPQTARLGMALKEFRRILTIEENPLAFVFNCSGSADLTIG